MPPRYLERPEARADHVNPTLALPYGMAGAGVVAAVSDVYAYLHALNSASVEYGYGRLEDIMQPAGFSGLLSNVFVRAIAREFTSATPGLAVNQHGNGRPDLVPRAVYPNDYILHGDEGIEVKASRSRTSWQGHNIEPGWLMIVQFEIDITTAPTYDRAPTTISRVMLARLEVADWNFSGRSATSRRTPTASVNLSGRAKLEVGTIYDRRSPWLTAATP
ncbi:MAG TPA: hypothetical protein VNJ04_04635 [Gemmatimonadaceae bacterium]|nr:hypothetical protein [Gemmatimonadaceae bacterium]